MTLCHLHAAKVIKLTVTAKEIHPIFASVTYFMQGRSSRTKIRTGIRRRVSAMSLYERLRPRQFRAESPTHAIACHTPGRRLWHTMNTCPQTPMNSRPQTPMNSRPQTPMNSRLQTPMNSRLQPTIHCSSRKGLITRAARARTGLLPAQLYAYVKPLHAIVGKILPYLAEDVAKGEAEAQLPVSGEARVEVEGVPLGTDAQRGVA